MLRIGEFSMLSTISIHMLRNYDKIGLLVPEHIDSDNGYRYYDIDQLLTANRIIAMKEMGFGLEEIKHSLYLSEEELNKLIQKKQIEKKIELQNLNEQLRRIETAIEGNSGEDISCNCSIAVKIFPDTITVSYRDKIEEYNEEGRLWGILNKESRKQKIEFDKDTLSLAINHGHDTTGKMDVEVLLSIKNKPTIIPPLNVHEIKKQQVASVIFKGNYEQFSRFNTYVAKWLEKNNYEINGEPFSVYHNSPGDGVPENEYITEICFPITAYIKK